MPTSKQTILSKMDLEWAIQAVQELTPSEPNLFTRWLKANDEKARLSANADFAHIVIHIDANNPNFVEALPNWLSADQVDAITSLCLGNHENHLGVISSELPVFWLSTPRGSRQGRLLILGLELLDAVVRELYPNAYLTRSELRTLVQLTTGLTLQEAATVDKVSYETKRSQVKAVFAKTDTKRQAEITSVFLSHILINFGSESYRSEANNTHKDFYHYIRNCLPANTRHHILVSPNGTQTRYLDVGPIDGSPAVLIHHTGVFYISEEEEKFLHANNLRLLCPLRSGALASQDNPLLLEEQMGHATEGIRMAQRMFCSGRVTLVCPLSGSFYGIEYLRQQPDDVENIIFVGAAYKGTKQATTAEKFRNYFYGIALRNNWLLTKLLAYIVEQVDKSDSIKRVFKNSYADSPLDMKILNTEFSDPAMCYAFEYRIKHSLASIQHDLYHQAKQNWSNFPVTDTQLHFIHGEEDRVHPLSAIKQFAQGSNNAAVYPIESAGSFIYHHHTPRVFSLIKQIMSAEE